MRYCVYGLGAIGGQVAGGLARAGIPTVGIARGATLTAVQQSGLILSDYRQPNDDGGAGRARVELRAYPSLTDCRAAEGDVDVVVLALKAPALLDVVEDLRGGLSAHTVVITAMNGLPWWFSDGVSTELDPLRDLLPAGRVLGSAIHLSAYASVPGQVVRTSGNRLVVGAATPHGLAAERQSEVVDDLRAAGFEVESTDMIRDAVWFKLWGNLSLNPASMLTRSSVDRIIEDPLTRTFVADCMNEAASIGDKLGIRLPHTPTQRLELTSRLGAFRTSMHQDAEAGRPVELEALLGSVRDLGVQVGVRTPMIDALLGLSRLHAEAHGLGTPARRNPS